MAQVGEQPYGPRAGLGDASVRHEQKHPQSEQSKSSNQNRSWDESVHHWKLWVGNQSFQILRHYRVTACVQVELTSRFDGMGHTVDDLQRAPQSLYILNLRYRIRSRTIGYAPSILQLAHLCTLDGSDPDLITGRSRASQTTH